MRSNIFKLLLIIHRFHISCTLLQYPIGIGICSSNIRGVFVITVVEVFSFEWSTKWIFVGLVVSDFLLRKIRKVLVVSYLQLLVFKSALWCAHYGQLNTLPRTGTKTISVLGTFLKAHTEFLLMASHHLEGCVRGTGENYPCVLPIFFFFFWTFLFLIVTVCIVA